METNRRTNSNKKICAVDNAQIQGNLIVMDVSDGTRGYLQIHSRGYLQIHSKEYLQINLSLYLQIQGS